MARVRSPENWEDSPIMPVTKGDYERAMTQKIQSFEVNKPLQNAIKVYAKDFKVSEDFVKASVFFKNARGSSGSTHIRNNSGRQITETEVMFHYQDKEARSFWYKFKKFFGKLFRR